VYGLAKQANQAGCLGCSQAMRVSELKGGVHACVDGGLGAKLG